MTVTGPPAKHQTFSLVKGGPVYSLFCRTGLCNEQIEPPFRRAVVIALIVWLPLLLFTIVGERFNSGVDIAFLNDIENHVRFLVALPLLIAGETSIERFLSPRIGNFVTRKIVRGQDIAKFESAIDSAHRMRDSIAIEIGMLIFVYAVGASLYGGVFASASAESPTWYATPDGKLWNLTLAGYWLIFVSLPIFQFFILRWCFRNLIWFVFLWRVSRLDLNLLPTHSDRAAGLGFLNKCAYSFGYGLLAQGALLSGYIAGWIMHFGGDPRNYKLEAAGLVLFAVGSVLLPLTVFTPKLIAAKWDGGGAYGRFASEYIQSFDEKWIQRNEPIDEPLLGTSDIQSLADLTNSYSVIAKMRTVPFSTSDIIYLAAMTLAPLLPLLLFVLSPEQLFDKVIEILF